MGVEVKEIAKDNLKLILSIVALIVVVAMMGMASVMDRGFFDFWNAEQLDPFSNDVGPSRPVVTDRPIDRKVGDAIPVSNGKNNYYSSEPEFQLENGVNYQADIRTNLGIITIDLYQNSSPNNVNNFVFLARNGFYRNTSFHRVIKDYIIQGGDPLGTGYGGPGYYVSDEIASGFRFKPYTVAMANSGADTNGSQFFIVSKLAKTSSLDGLYTPIGEVVSGMNVISDIEKVDVDSRYMPYEAVIIHDIEIRTR